MTEKIITITSKNQITLPAEYVRQLKLTKNRQLKITAKNGKLVLRPEPSLRQRLERHWQTLPSFQGTKTDEELKRTSREAWANKKV